MSAGKLSALAIMIFVALMFVRAFGLPTGNPFSGMSLFGYGLPIILAIAGAAMVYKKINGGGWLIILALAIIWLGTDNVAETGKNLGQGARELSRDLVENGLDVERSGAKSPRPEIRYDLLVPASGCSDLIENTNPNFWVDPRPKDPSTGWPKHTQMVSPETGKGWVPYRSGARYSHLRYCDNGSEMWMTISFYRGRM